MMAPPTTGTANRSTGRSRSTPLASQIRKPHAHDVLLGRGGASNHHHGNAVFRSVISKTRPLYRTVPKSQKIIVARSIVQAVSRQDPPGRFLERDKKTKLWYEVGPDRAVEKAKQALREREKSEDGSDDDTGDGDGDGDGAGVGSSRSTIHSAAEKAQADKTNQIAHHPGAHGEGLAKADARSAAAREQAEAAALPAPSVPVARLPPPLAPNAARGTACGGGGTALSVATFLSTAASGGGSSGLNLTPAEEAQAAKYRNMIKIFHVDPSIVESKMKTENLPPHVVRSVLADASVNPYPGGGGHHVQFAAGTAGGAAAAHIPMPRQRRVSSVLLNMLGFGDESAAPPRGSAVLPPEVRDVLDDIVPEEDEDEDEDDRKVVAAAAALSSGATTATTASTAATTASRRRRLSIFDLFRRKSRAVGGGHLTQGQRACTSIQFDAESQRRLLTELDAGAEGGGGATTEAAGQKRKASSLRQSPPPLLQRPTMAEAAALAAAEVGPEADLDDLEPEDPLASPRRMSLTPHAFGRLLSAIGHAPSQEELPPTPQPAPLARQESGLIHQTASMVRRSLVETANLFSAVIGPDADEPSGRPGKRRRSTWLSGLHFSTVEPAAASARSAVAAAEAVRGMDLVKDDSEEANSGAKDRKEASKGGARSDRPASHRVELRSLGKGAAAADRQQYI